MFDVPILFFDLETTGVDPEEDRIVQFAGIRTTPNHEPVEFTFKCNPEIEISEGASRVHGITNEEAKQYAAFDAFSDKLYRMAHGAIWAGYNNFKFDIPMFMNEFKRRGLKVPECAGVLDGYKLFTHFYGPAGKGKRTLKAAHVHYCGYEFEDAHDAVADIKATINVFENMIIEHGDDLKMFLKVSEATPLKIDFKGMFIFDPKRKVAVLGYGKYKGVPLAEVPVSYFKWIIDTTGFNADTKKIASEACRGIFPQYQRPKFKRNF